MSFAIIITQQARDEIRAASGWWAEHRSAEQAERWYDGILSALYGLDTYPESHSLARENDVFSYELRELHFGLSSHPTHRALFTIQSDAVIVLSIRHAAQRNITPADIAEQGL